MPDPITTGSVKLSTWGTHNEGGNGMAHYMDASLFGGNVGHASVEITITADAQGEELVRKYCMKEATKVIPFERVAQYALDEHGKPVKQEVFKIYFSWWPEKKNASINQDSAAERTGVDVGPIDARFTQGEGALAQREQREYRGLLGSRKAHLAHNEVAHITPLDENQRKLLAAENKSKEIEDAKAALALIDKKIKGKNNVAVEGSLLALLNNQLPDWKTGLANTQTLQTADIEKILLKIEVKKQALVESTRLNEEARIEASTAVTARANLAINTEVANIVRDLALLPPLEQAAKIERRDPPYSRAAWVQYEKAEVDKVLKLTMAVHPFFTQDFNEKKKMILDALFDRQYPVGFRVDPLFENWRQFLPPESRLVTRENMTPELYQAVRQNAKALMDTKADRMQKLQQDEAILKTKDSFEQGDRERFVTKGLAPDHQIRFPISGLKEGQHQQFGLNVEGMLKKMRDLTEDGKKFHLSTKNCSLTTGAILGAGAEPELRDYFKEKAWGGFGNPQVVLNAASKYQHCILKNKGQKSTWEKIATSKYNPLNFFSYIGGKILYKLASPDTHWAAKFGLGLLGVPVAGIAAGVELLKAVVNPKETFTRCKDFVNYAWQNNSIFLKICSVPAALLTGAFALPALIQHGLGKLVSSDSLSSASNKEAAPVDNHQKIAADKTIEINELKPKVAIERIKTLLRENPDSVPLLSAQTQSAVNAYLQTLDRTKPEDREVLKDYDRAIKALYDRVNEVTRPVPALALAPALDRQPDPHLDNLMAPQHRLSAFENARDRGNVTVHVPTGQPTLSVPPEGRQSPPKLSN